MLRILAFLTVLLLAACGKADQLEAHYTGYAKICVDGVEYIQFTSGAALSVDTAGKPRTCATKH